MIRTLVKNRLLSVFGTMTMKSKRGPKKPTLLSGVFIVLVYLFAVGSFAFISTAAAMALGSVLIPFGAGWLYYAIFFIASFSIVFIFSIFETKGELFDCKDNDFLLSMPIKPRDIVVARISVVLIYNYVEALIVMLPAIIYYGIKSGDVVGIFGGLFITIFIPLIATALASAVGYLVAYLSKKIKKNNAIIVTFAIAFIVLYFFGYEFVMNKMELFLANVMASGGVAKEQFSFLYHLGNSALFAPVSTAIITLSSLIVSALAYILISRRYFSLITASVKTKAKYKSEKIREKSILSTLISKEIRCFFSSPTYMLNTGIGLIFEVIIGVVAVVKSDSISMLATALMGGTSDAEPALMLVPLMISAIVTLSAFNTMSACSLSLEGKRLWILRTIPVKDLDVLHAKVAAQIVLTFPPTLATSVLFIIASASPIEYWIFFILIPFFAITFSATLGTVINVFFPKFKFVNEVEPIKQSLSVFASMMINMLLGAGVLVGSFFLLTVVNPMTVVLLTLLAYVLLTAIFYTLLRKVSVRIYSKFEV